MLKWNGKIIRHPADDTSVLLLFKAACVVVTDGGRVHRPCIVALIMERRDAPKN
jgi:hypothetical protein